MVQTVPDDYFPVVQPRRRKHRNTYVKPSGDSRGDGTADTPLSSSSSGSFYKNWVKFSVTPNETFEAEARRVTRLMDEGLLDEAIHAAADTFGFHSVAVNGTLLAAGMNAALHYLCLPLSELFQHYLPKESFATLTNRSVLAAQYALCQSWNTTNVGIEYFFVPTALISRANIFFGTNALAPSTTLCIYPEAVGLLLCFALVAMILLLRARYKKYYDAIRMYAAPDPTID